MIETIDRDLRPAMAKVQMPSGATQAAHKGGTSPVVSDEFCDDISNEIKDLKTMEKELLDEALKQFEDTAEDKKRKALAQAPDETDPNEQRKRKLRDSVALWRDAAENGMKVRCSIEFMRGRSKAWWPLQSPCYIFRYIIMFGEFELSEL